MAKDKITEYDATAANNTVVGDVNLAENSALPSDMNNAVREVMSHQKEAFGSGTPLYVDQTNNRVGVNNSAPSTALEADADGATVLTVDRATSDGVIIDVQKDGSSVGSIKAAGGNLTLNSASNYGLLQNADATQYVWSNSSGSGAFYPESDNARDLGTSSKRFQDLYLSGGLYVGGTGSANLLEDYEEGTWTPVLDFGGSSTGITYSTQSATYTKIGRLVVVAWRIYLANKGSATGHAHVSGFPYAAASIPSGGVFQYISNRGGLSLSDEHAYLYFLNSVSRFPVYQGDNDSTGNGTVSDGAFGNTTELEGFMQYTTSS